MEQLDSLRHRVAGRPFLIAAWSLACLDRWALPVAAAMGIFVTQTQIAYLPLVLIVGGVALVVWLARIRRRRESLLTWRVPVAIAAGLFVLAWLPPTIDALAHHPSNLDQLREFRGNQPVSRLTQLAMGGGPRRGGSPDSWMARLTSPTSMSPGAGSWASLVTFGGVVLAGAVAIRRRYSDVLVLLGLLAFAFAACVYAVSEVAGPLVSHLVLWMSVLSVMAWVAVGASVIPDVERSRGAARICAAVAVIGGSTAVTLAWPGFAPIIPGGQRSNR